MTGEYLDEYWLINIAGKMVVEYCGARLSRDRCRIDPHWWVNSILIFGIVFFVVLTFRLMF